MSEPIDQQPKHLSKREESLKRGSLWMMITVFIVIAYCVYRVLRSKMNLDSPLLPTYTVFWVNASLINFTCISVLGLLPGVYFRVRKMYLLSISASLAFFLLGFLVKDMVPFFRLFTDLL